MHEYATQKLKYIKSGKYDICRFIETGNQFNRVGRFQSCKRFLGMVLNPSGVVDRDKCRILVSVESNRKFIFTGARRPWILGRYRPAGHMSANYREPKPAFYFRGRDRDVSVYRDNRNSILFMGYTCTNHSLRLCDNFITAMFVQIVIFTITAIHNNTIRSSPPHTAAASTTTATTIKKT